MPSSRFLKLLESISKLLSIRNKRRQGGGERFSQHGCEKFLPSERKVGRERKADRIKMGVGVPSLPLSF